MADLVKNAEFQRECGRAKCFFSQSSKPNELIFNTMFYDSVCLKVPHGSGSYIQNGTTLKIVTSRVCDITNRRAVGTFLCGPYWIRTSKSLSCRQTDKHTDTSTDNKGRLKLAGARANNDVTHMPNSQIGS